MNSKKTKKFEEQNIWKLAIEDFISNTGYYPILFTILEISKESLLEYLSDWTHIVLYISAILQSYLIGLAKKKKWSILPFLNLTMVSLYTLSELLTGKPFLDDYFHILFWFYSFTFMIFDFFSQRKKNVIYHIFHACLRTSIISSFYFIYEISQGGKSILVMTLINFYKDPVHLFLVSGMLMIGLLLGISNYRREQYLSHLSGVSNLLYEYSSWHLGGVLDRGLNDPSIYSLKRRKKLIMFMDIRKFTSFSEKHSPEDVVNLLSLYYKNAEVKVKSEEIQILKFTADEIMCSFESPESGIKLAVDLHKSSNELLTPFGLSSGMALHYGEVLEGLIGGELFKNFDIIGDSVNTASRIEKISGNEILISEEVKSFLPTNMEAKFINKMSLKGKNQLVNLYSIK